MTRYIVSGDDVYLVTVSPIDRKFFSDDIFMLIDGRLNILNVELSRLHGSHTTNLHVLSQIEDIIAETFLSNKDAVLCFYCDFISPIPSSRKPISPQLYRSLLFLNMFDRYKRRYQIHGIDSQVISIKGIDETYYIHLIYWERHAKDVELITKDITDGYSK